MTNKSGHIGSDAETAVVKVLHRNGFGQAERCRTKGSSGDTGDLTGTPGVCWEIKGGAAARNASEAQVIAWLDETETERRNAGAVIGSLVLHRRGYGYANAGGWWVVITAQTLAMLWVAPDSLGDQVPLLIRMRLDHWCTILRAAGYGDALPGAA